jgi:diacylglycerol kinase
MSLGTSSEHFVPQHSYV